MNLGFDDEPAIDDAEDGEGVKQGEQAAIPQLRRSDRKYRSFSKYPNLEYILLTNEGRQGVLKKFKHIWIESIG